MTDPVLSVRGLVKRYGATTVLAGIDLDVHEHEVVVLIGSSGSGKSTLLRCANLLEDLDDGQIVIAQVGSAAASRLTQDQPVRVDVSADAVLVVPD